MQQSLVVGEILSFHPWGRLDTLSVIHVKAILYRLLLQRPRFSREFVCGRDCTVCLLTAEADARVFRPDSTPCYSN